MSAGEIRGWWLVLAVCLTGCDRPAERGAVEPPGTGEATEASQVREPRLQPPEQSAEGSGSGQSAMEHLEHMAQEHAGDSPVPTEATAEAPRQPVTSETVTYATVGGQPVSGYLSRPTSATGPLPALVVIHEWWGLNDNIRAMADRLAGEGYEALAIDLYRGQLADTPERARELVEAALDDMPSGQDNVRQAVAWLRQRNPEQPIGAIGWCFGGGWALQTGLTVPEEVRAVVIYYGRLVTEPDELAPLQAAVLGHFGATDESIPIVMVRGFETLMQRLGKTVEAHVYEGAGHAFANASGHNYQPEAARQAWERTVAFLSQHMR